MTEILGDSRRTHYCGEIIESLTEHTVAVAGWVQKQRDLGSLIFIDLRDRSGIVQLAFDDNSDRKVFEKAFAVRSEYVLFAKGRVRERSSKNPNIPTGNIEIFVEELKVLSVSETPPFEITDDTNANEELRLKYRFLDLRRSSLTNNMIFRHEVAKTTREYFFDNGFIEIETPNLIKSTPEGARDYLVPSRIHKGSFYALPQSPQLYKQICMVSGLDRYFQLARCFRDEDLRSDRQPEFTQIDFEMSFTGMEDILELTEGYIKKLFKDVMDIEIKMPIPRYSYNEVMERYGSDKPDMRFGMEIKDLTPAVKGCGFGVFTSAIEGGGSVMGINAAGFADVLSRKEIDKLTEYARSCGAKGLAWVKSTTEGTSSSFSKFMTQEEMDGIIKTAGMAENDVLLIIADTDRAKVLSQLGLLRIYTANHLGIERSGFEFLWVVEMPYFEFDNETGEYIPMHHAFTAPMDEYIDVLETDKANIKAKAYDLVLNGIELSSGSIRITDPALQSRIFKLIGIDENEAKEKFGFLLEAFKYGPPPHGGMGIGLDRLVMQMLGAQSLKDVVAFPKVQNASELMTECPAAVDKKALDELGIELKGDRKNG